MAAIRVILFCLILVPTLCYTGPNTTKIIFDDKQLALSLQDVNGIYKDPVKANANSGTVLVTAW